MFSRHLLCRFEYLDGLERNRRELNCLIRKNGAYIMCHVIAEKAEGVCSEERERKKPPLYLVVHPHTSLTDNGAISKVSVLDPVPCISSSYVTL